ADRLRFVVHQRVLPRNRASAGDSRARWDGRRAMFEVLLPGEGLRGALRRAARAEELRAAAEREGFPSLARRVPPRGASGEAGESDGPRLSGWGGAMADYDLRALLTFAKEQGASDLHLSAGQPPALRLRGDLVRLDMPPFTPEETNAAIEAILTEGQKKAFEERKDLDFAFAIHGVSRFRANLLQQQRGPAAVFRVVPAEIQTLEALAMPKVLKELASLEKGLVLVTGPTGSGKSTTLAAMVDYVNETTRGHILTVEDPI